ncbi:hypothetical protein VTJ49DRAFT_2777 [Mycothermus thermophilus]|uniref:Rrn9 domain-containing protein n=1 Tax=Humicola insolens TaxID=85995 RepID=A0ABR3VA82_HUMIN
MDSSSHSYSSHHRTNKTKRKRKRASSASTAATDAVINPLSHPPDTLRQFALAGYPADQPLPSRAYPGFPHRPPRLAWSVDEADEDENEPRGGGASSESSRRPRSRAPGGPGEGASASDADVDTNAEDGDHDDDDDDGTTTAGWQTTDAETDGQTTADESSSTPRRKVKGKSGTLDRRSQAYRTRVGALVAIVRRALAEGDIPTARRAFGLLARARVYGRRVDLRWGRIWEMGAEVLMREGEGLRQRKGGRGVLGGEEGINGEGLVKKEDSEGEDGVGGEQEVMEEEEEEEEEAAEARLGRLKAYYEYLIQQYPYTKQHAARSGPSAVDFHVALFSTEMEAAHDAHRRGLEKLERGDDELDDDIVEDENEEDVNAWDRQENYNDDAMDMDAPEPEDYYHDLRLGSSSDEDADARRSKKRHDRHRNALSSFHGHDQPHLPPPPPTLSRRERRRLQREDELRRTALQRMASVAERMDTAMEAVPFSRDAEMLRLRAMVALYIADLSIPPSTGVYEVRSGRRERAKERRKARDLLRRIKDGGGKLQEHDVELLRSLEADDEEEDEQEGENEEHGSQTAALPLFSSMEF